MINPTQLKESIKDLKWPAGEKQRLLDLWPNLPGISTDFFYNEVFTFGSELIAGDINNALRRILEAQLASKEGNLTPWLAILKEAPDSPDFDLGRYVMPFLGWLRGLVNSKEGGTELLNTINEFDFQTLNELTQEEALRMVESSLLFFMGKIDLLKRYRWYFNSRAGFNLSWLSKCCQAMEKNQEFLGQTNIDLSVSGEEKKVTPAIKNWVTDYNSFAHADPISNKRSSFQQTNFLLHSSNIQKLNGGNKEILLKIIQFYDWLRYQKISTEDQGESKPTNNTPYLTSNKFDLPSETFQGRQPQKPWPPKIPTPPKISPIQQNTLNQPIRPVSQPTPVNIQDILKTKDHLADDYSRGSGLKFGENSDQGSEQKNPKTSIDIDKKLEELKKRLNN
jgi:hypothetical protein